MKFNARILSSAAAIVITCAVSAAACYYKSRAKEINEVMVFCKLQFNVYSCFDKLISYVEAAKKSIDVCMPSIQNPAIQARLVKLLLKKNIKTRIIIDRKGYNDTTDFFLKELVEAGAEIKCRVHEPYNMQHKFCLVDGEVLMTGTLNWGDELSSDNWNYVYITSKPQLVTPVKREFQIMWNRDMALQDALKIEPVYVSDEETPEVEEIIDVESVKKLENLQKIQIETQFYRETQVTPELSIM